MINMAQAQFSQAPFKCFKCGNDHKNFSPTDTAPVGATLQPIFEPSAHAQARVQREESDDDEGSLLDLALGVGSAVLDIASAVSDSSDSSGGDSWGGGGGDFGGGGASSDW